MHCPICRHVTAWKDNPWRPFCCERCQLIDLGTWAAEEYRVPGSSLIPESSRGHGEDDYPQRDVTDRP